jgi:hypothetical protein
MRTIAEKWPEISASAEFFLQWECGYVPQSGRVKLDKYAAVTLVSLSRAKM